MIQSRHTPGQLGNFLLLQTNIALKLQVFLFNIANEPVIFVIDRWSPSVPRNRAKSLQSRQKSIKPKFRQKALRSSILRSFISGHLPSSATTNSEKARKSAAAFTAYSVSSNLLGWSWNNRVFSRQRAAAMGRSEEQRTVHRAGPSIAPGTRSGATNCLHHSRNFSNGHFRLAKTCHGRFNSAFVFPPAALKPTAMDSQKRQN
jgi:hypothetical protein